VKNTFIDFGGTEMSPVRVERRTRTAAAVLHGRVAESSSDDEDEYCPEEPRFVGGPGAARTPEEEMEAKCAALGAQIGSGGVALDQAMAVLRGSVWTFACDKAGCRVVQLALERGRTQDAEMITAELHGHVVDAVVHPHANHVMQKIIEQVSPSSLYFIAKELTGEAKSAVRHKYGCRIFCRLAEFDPNSHCSLALFDEILGSDVVQLCNHDFGHHFVNQIVEHGPLHLRAEIIRALSSQGTEVVRFAKQKNASQVLERALRNGAEQDPDREHLAAHLLAQPGTFGALVCHVYGSHVARALLAQPPTSPMFYRAFFMWQKAAANTRTRKDRYGQQMLREWGWL
jgi:hypothetical protein